MDRESQERFHPESKPFWEAAANGRFLIKRCTECAEPHWYPRQLCPFCLGDTVWEESRGEGEIYTFTLSQRDAGAVHARGYVVLDEGPAVYTALVARNWEALRIGARAKVVLPPEEPDKFPRFELLD
ncbi:MAG: Zn-ribbon domain-containing OB-fold protein [Flavobacteriaceae bacterium]